MVKRTNLSWLMLALCLAVLAATGGIAAAADKAEVVSGTIAKVDAAKKQLTITTADNKQLTLDVEDADKVSVNSAAGKLSDLKPGTKVTASYVPKGGKNTLVALRTSK